MRAPLLLLLLLGLSTGAQGAAKARPRATKQRQHKPAPPKAAPEPTPPSEAASSPSSLASPRQHTSNKGSVTYVSAECVYLDRGKDEGLAVGAEVALSRRGKPAGSCRVEWVADHHATCQGQGLRVGDQFTLAAPVAPPAPAPRPTPAPPTELARWRSALESAPHPLVEFAGGGADRRTSAEVRLEHTSWYTTNVNSTFHQERADVSLRGMPLFGGFRLYLDATAVGWTSRPEGFRALARLTARLYVRGGELVAREPGSHLALAVGRVWPWFVLGVAVFDGAQVGWRSQDGDFEVGGFGGGVPDPVSLSPSFARVAANAYLAGRSVGEEDATLRLLQYEARVSYMSAPQYSTRVELEGRARAWLGERTDVGLWARLGMGEAQAPGTVDAARLDVAMRPSEHWRFSGSVRYDGGLALDLPPMDGVELGSRALHGEVTATWQPTAGFSAGVMSVAARDIEKALGRQLVGPELGFPRLFGARGGLSLGYLEELGWQKGRSGYLQTMLQPGSSVRVIGRLSYFEDGPPPDISDALPTRDAGLYASTEYAPTRWLTVRASLLTRVAINAVAPFGLIGSASLAGRF